MFTQDQIQSGLHCPPFLTTGLEGISSNLHGNTLKYLAVSGALLAHASVSEIHSCFLSPRPCTFLYRSWPPFNSSAVGHAHCGEGRCKYSLVVGFTSTGTSVSAFVPFKSLRGIEGGKLEVKPAGIVSCFLPSLFTPLSTVAWKGGTDDDRGG